ncbi:MAG: OB-fold nucleic acid binding domain-containing protein, partial [Pseudomonadota bacterium]
AVFACALLNSQPMGFYAPAQIVRDARDHDVEVRPVDVNHSLWDCTLEPALDSTAAGSGSPDGLALRLGLRQVKGLAEDEAARLLAGRANGYPDPLILWRRAGVKPASLEALARADAFGSMGLSRREALWALKGLPLAPLPLFAAMGEEERGPEPHVQLPKMTEGEEVAADYASLRLSLKAHPLSFLRAGLAAEGRIPAAQLKEISDGTRIDLAGLVLVRQRPGSAKGVIFATLEDETGVANVIVWPDRFERYRPIVLGARLLAVRGKLQKEGLVIHIVADELFDLSERLYDLTDPARRSQPLSETMGPETLARADEVKRPPRTLPTNDVISHPRFEPPHPIRHPRNVNPMPRSRDFR